MSRILVATGSKVIDLNGERVAIVKGRTTAEEGAAIVEACPDMFAPLVPTHSSGRGGGGIEQATAAPGEKRNASLPDEASDTARKATAKKKATKKATGKKDANDGDDDDTPDDGDDA